MVLHLVDPGFSVWQWQGIGIAFFMLLFWYMEKTAAMRGQTGEPLPRPVNRALRVIFFGVLFGPICWTFPILLPVALVYLPTYASLAEIDGHGRKTGWIRRLGFWRYLHRYFGCKLVKTAELSANHTYVLGLHPHSILPFGTMLNLCSDVGEMNMDDVFPGVEFHGLAASMCFYIPLYRDLVLGAGVVDAARFSAKKVLNQGGSLFLVPGGATEALYATPEKDVLYLRKRLGFVRLAIQHGAALVPSFSFNECNTWDAWDPDWELIKYAKRKFQAVFGLSLPLLKNIIPKRTQITTVVGKPIHCKQEDTPSQETVVEYLEKYIAQIEELYEEHGPKYNIPKDKKLSII